MKMDISERTAVLKSEELQDTLQKERGEARTQQEKLLAYKQSQQEVDGEVQASGPKKRAPCRKRLLAWRVASTQGLAKESKKLSLWESVWSPHPPKEYGEREKKMKLILPPRKHPKSQTCYKNCLKPPPSRITWRKRGKSEAESIAKDSNKSLNAFLKESE